MSSLHFVGDVTCSLFPFGLTSNPFTIFSILFSSLAVVELLPVGGVEFAIAGVTSPEEGGDPDSGGGGGDVTDGLLPEGVGLLLPALGSVALLWLLCRDPGVTVSNADPRGDPPRELDVGGTTGRV
jgi:hypothetical protein